MVIKINPRNPSPEVIQRAARVIHKGGLVIFPTETVYGLGADAFNARAVAKIFKVKGRPEGKPLIVHVSKKSTIDVLARDIPRVARVLVKKFWPGPLTLVLKRKIAPPLTPPLRGGGIEQFPLLSKEGIKGWLDTIAIRMPDHPVARALIRAAGPLAAPSANFSGEKPPTRVSGIPRTLLEQVDLVLDAGLTRVKTPSTVVDLTVNPPKILREGVINEKQIRKFL